MLLTVVMASLLGQVKTLVPDAQYEPVVGDVVRIYRADGRQLKPVPVAFNPDEWRALQRWVQAKDDAGIKTMEEKGLITWLDTGTEIRVVEINTFGTTPARRQALTGLLVSAAYQDPMERFDVVRVMDGKQKDKLVCVDKEWVKRCRTVAVKGKAKGKARTKRK